jgi:hypothetical protein
VPGHRMSLRTQARALAGQRRRIAMLGASDPQRTHNAAIYLDEYSRAGLLARLWSHLITWELDRIDRATIGAAIEAAQRDGGRWP